LAGWEFDVVAGLSGDGFPKIAATAEPEEVLDFLCEYHGALGPLVSQFVGVYRTKSLPAANVTSPSEPMAINSIP
jgi:hypothetical protein